jgi:hypothetical protein
VMSMNDLPATSWVTPVEFQCKLAAALSLNPASCCRRSWLRVGLRIEAVERERIGARVSGRLVNLNRRRRALG